MLVGCIPISRTRRSRTRATLFVSMRRSVRFVGDSASQPTFKNKMSNIKYLMIQEHVLQSYDVVVVQFFEELQSW